MTIQDMDLGIRTVVELIQVVVSSEGGSIEFVSLRDGCLTVRYNEGRNDECPECVPSRGMVHQMISASLGIHAPHVRELKLI